MVESWMGLERDPREWRTWRPVVAIVIVLVIMIVAAIDLAQPAWLLVGLIGPATLAGDEAARRHRRRATRGVDLGAGGSPPPSPPVTP